MLRAVAAEIEDTALAHTATMVGAAPPRSPTTDLAEGLRLGHFKIEKKLAAGGMGEVYLATDLALDRPVAIKVLPEATVSGAARERMIREARAQARIQHPNVAHIYFIGEESGRLYFAMELLAGQTLADRASAGPMSIEEAIAAIRAAALGLREAHRAGFTHRDVKPSNLMTDAHGTVKVLDFGLVAAVPTAQLTSGPVEQTSLGGTPLYMAPEQARGEAIDLRADIYALGATLYHLVSGRPPFPADTVGDLATLHATAARPMVPRKGHARSAIAALDPLIARMMAPDPADRFASYDELVRELDLVSTQHTRPAGAWVRTIAALIDFMIPSLMLALFSIPFGGIDLGGNMIFAMTFAYSTLALARWGTTAGKALLELEVISVATTKRPSLSRAFVRELALFGPVILVTFAHQDNLANTVLKIATAILVAAPLVAMFHAALRVPGKRAPWDRIAGTQVRYRVAQRSMDGLLP
ncbi:hypothetical protein BH11MYX1_BH11MYX1_29140 [soil metagenome]